MLERKPEELDLDVPIPDLGVESILLAELRSEVEAELDLDLPVGLFLSNPSINQLAAQIAAML